MLIGRSAFHSALGQAQTVWVSSNEGGNSGYFHPCSIFLFQCSGLCPAFTTCWRGPEAHIFLSWTRTFNTLCLSVCSGTHPPPRFSTRCDASSGHFSLSVHPSQLVWKLEPETLDKSLATLCLQVVTYCCAAAAYSWNQRLRLHFWDVR